MDYMVVSEEGAEVRMCFGRRYSCVVWCRLGLALGLGFALQCDDRDPNGGLMLGCTTAANVNVLEGRKGFKGF